MREKFRDDIHRRVVICIARRPARRAHRKLIRLIGAGASRAITHCVWPAGCGGSTVAAGSRAGAGMSPVCGRGHAR